MIEIFEAYVWWTHHAACWLHGAGGPRPHGIANLLTYLPIVVAGTLLGVLIVIMNRRPPNSGEPR